MTKDHYRELFEKSSDANLILIEDKFADCNEAAAKMLRYESKQDLLSTHPSQLSPEFQPDGCSSYEKANKMIAIAIDKGSHRFEWDHKRADGEIFPVEVLLTCLKEPGANTLHVVWRDISERKRAEKTLTRLTSIIESTSDMVSTATTDGKIQFINNAGLRMLGLKRENIATVKISDCHPAWALKIVESGMQVAIDKGVWNGESVIQNNDGHEIFVSQVIMSHKSAQGKLEFFSTIIRDISGRIETENALQNNIRLLNSIIENQPSCLKLIRSDGTLLQMNPAGLKMVGAKSKSEVIGKNIYDLLVEPDRELFQKFNEKICRGEKGTLKFSMCALDGSTHKMNSVSVPINYGPEKEIVQLAITTDITQELASQEENRMLETQLNQARKMESIGTLAGGIAHDFNNILAAIIGYAELAILESESPKKLHRDLNGILKGANRAKKLIQQILTFGRKSSAKIQPIRVQFVIEEVLNLLRSSLPSSIEIKIDINQDCQTILADPTQIHQIIMNLCTNSYQSMKGKPGILNISLKPVTLNQEDVSGNLHLEAGSYVELIVSDSGAGMPQEVLEKVFEPYFTTKEKGEGTGLGLAVAHGIVTSLRGDIQVSSEVGVGTAFKVFFPVVNMEEKDLTLEDANIPMSRNNEHIFFVDDDEVIALMVSIMLEQLGYRVTTISSSLDAIKKFRQESGKFDLVITDMTMPKMSGEELVLQIQAIKPKVPIILCSGYSELMSEEKAKSMGIHEYILKPVSRKDLATAVSNALYGS